MANDGNADSQKGIQFNGNSNPAAGADPDALQVTMHMMPKLSLLRQQSVLSTITCSRASTARRTFEDAVDHQHQLSGWPPLMFAAGVSPIM